MNRNTNHTKANKTDSPIFDIRATISYLHCQPEKHLIRRVSGMTIGCPNICAEYPDVYPEYPGCRSDVRVVFEHLPGVSGLLSYRRIFFSPRCCTTLFWPNGLCIPLSPLAARLRVRGRLLNSSGRPPFVLMSPSHCHGWVGFCFTKIAISTCWKRVFVGPPTSPLFPQIQVIQSITH